jgi:hypothetical protein
MLAKSDHKIHHTWCPALRLLFHGPFKYDGSFKPKTSMVKWWEDFQSLHNVSQQLLYIWKESTESDLKFPILFFNFVLLNMKPTKFDQKFPTLFINSLLHEIPLHTDRSLHQTLSVLFWFCEPLITPQNDQSGSVNPKQHHTITSIVLVLWTPESPALFWFSEVLFWFCEPLNPQPCSGSVIPLITSLVLVLWTPESPALFSELLDH